MDFSEELRDLVYKVVDDGKITKKEREVLHKRAEKEGIDIDEFDIYIDQLAKDCQLSFFYKYPFIEKLIKNPFFWFAIIALIGVIWDNISNSGIGLALIAGAIVSTLLYFMYLENKNKDNKDNKEEEEID